jgi:hypothetical protein
MDKRSQYQKEHNSAQSALLSANTFFRWRIFTGWTMKAKAIGASSVRRGSDSALHFS